jgi:hypothetical protein
MTIKELSNIIKKYREQRQQQESHGTQTLTLDEARARELLGKLMITSNDAYNERKRKWFKTLILYLGVS